MPDPVLAPCVPSFGDGGAERMMTQLARGLVDLGYPVDLVVRRRAGRFLDALPPMVRVVELDRIGSGPLSAAVTYLRATAPAVMVSSKPENNALAVAARRRANVRSKLYVRAASAESARSAGQLFLTRWSVYRGMRRVFRQADGVIAVSRDLADDVAAITGIPVQAIHVAHNPVVTPEMLALARLFVLPSVAEESPNALTETLALGVPVVSTDCRSGPREILEGGRYGRLVPVGDEEAPAAAMLETLRNPPPAEVRQEAALPFTIDGSAREYAAILGLESRTASAAGRR